MAKITTVRGASKVQLGVSGTAELKVPASKETITATKNAMTVKSSPTTSLEISRPKAYARAEGMFLARQDIASKLGLLSDDLRILRCDGEYLASEFSGIVVAFTGNQTSYKWGPWLNRINNAPYQHYFSNRHQIDQLIPLPTCDPRFASTQGSVWGSTQLNLIGMRGSRRFGGSVELTLAPIEDFGIELGDIAKNLYVDLHRWLVRVYIQLNADVFNNPTMPVVPTSAVIEAFDTEVYTRQSERYVPNSSATESDVAALLVTAESELLSKLNTLVFFALGFIHEQKLVDFTQISYRVDAVQLSDRFIAFHTTSKTPYIEVRMATHYFGTSSLEGIFDDDAEVTAEPWLLLKESGMGLVVLSSEREKYIGSHTSTGMMVMGRLSLDDIARVKYVLAFNGWTENDPISNEFGSSFGFEFNVAFDRAALQSRADSEQLGKIGETLYAFQAEDVEYAKVSYAVEIEFHLVKV